jgi:hypothetical protein
VNISRRHDTILSRNFKLQVVKLILFFRRRLKILLIWRLVFGIIKYIIYIYSVI